MHPGTIAMSTATYNAVPRLGRIPCHKNPPILNILFNAAGGEVTVRFSDRFSPSSGFKPKDAIELELHVALGDEPLPPDAAEFVDSFIRNPIKVQFEPEDDGKVATYYARWVSQNGERGPWSLPESMRVAV